MKIGDTWTPVVQALDASGAALTGLVLGDWSVAVRVGGVAQTVAITAMAHLGGGYYALTLTIPAVVGWHRYAFTATGASIYVPPSFSGWVGKHDEDSLAALTALRAPASGSVAGFVPQPPEYAIDLVQDDDITVTIPLFDDAGDPLDLTGASYAFGVQNAEQSTLAGVLPYEQTDGITGSGGVVSIVIPGSASFYAALPVGADQVALRWSLLVTLSSLSRTRRRGVLRVLRKETT